MLLRTKGDLVTKSLAYTGSINACSNIAYFGFNLVKLAISYFKGREGTYFAKCNGLVTS